MNWCPFSARPGESGGTLSLPCTFVAEGKDNCVLWDPREKHCIFWSILRELQRGQQQFH